MIRQHFPHFRIRKHRSEIFHIPDVDAIQSEYWKPCGKCPGHTSDTVIENLLEPGYSHDRFLCTQAPVIEIACNDQRDTKRHFLVDKTIEPLDLLLPMGFTQTKMYTDDMDVIIKFR